MVTCRTRVCRYRLDAIVTCSFSGFERMLKGDPVKQRLFSFILQNIGTIKKKSHPLYIALIYGLSTRYTAKEIE